MRLFSRLFCGGVSIFVLAGALRAQGTWADSVVEYVPGTISSASLQQNGNAAIGLPATVDDGQTTPFTPPFHASSITIIGAGGHITLHFAAPVLDVPGPDIGVFTNTGLVASVVGGQVTATAGPGVFSTDTAIVSVSQDDVTWVALNGGNPLNLTMPANAFVDTTLSSSGGITASSGATPSNPFLPFTGTLSQFGGLTYPAMVSLLNGSAGGAWIDASSANLPQINYLRFDVPAGDRLVLDAVTAASAVPEPATVGMLELVIFILNARRPRRGAFHFSSFQGA